MAVAFKRFERSKQYINLTDKILAEEKLEGFVFRIGETGP